MAYLQRIYSVFFLFTFVSHSHPAPNDQSQIILSILMYLIDVTFFLL